MKFINIYETTNAFHFYDAVELLERNNIDYQKLHEFRLQPEWNIIPEGEPAIIRVMEKDAKSVRDLLIENGLIKTNSQVKEIVEWKERSTLEQEKFKDDIRNLKNRKLEKITYIDANGINFDLGSIHSVDFGFCIQFENNFFLSWNFEESYKDFENNYFLPDRFELKFKNILDKVDKDYNQIDVSQNEYWTPFLNKPIKDIKIYCQEFGKEKIVTDVVMEIGGKRIAIFSVEEPTEKEDKIKVHLPISNDWTIIVFDEETIRKSDRVEC